MLLSRMAQTMQTARDLANQASISLNNTPPVLLITGDNKTQPSHACSLSIYPAARRSF